MGKNSFCRNDEKTHRRNERKTKKAIKINEKGTKNTN